MGIASSNHRPGLKRSLEPRTFLHLTFFELLWIFVAGCIIGYVGEEIFHFVFYHEFEDRAGFVWGPFSSIYGLGAVILTVVINRLYWVPDVAIFLVCMVLGSTMEFCASWMMETFWNAIAWDYTGTLGSIGGRTNLFFGLLWGFVGLLWARLILPFLKRVFNDINFKNTIVRVVSILMTIFMVANAIFTILALHRAGERVENIPPTTVIDQCLDEWFPDEFIQERFHNMTVTTDIQAEKQGIRLPD